LGGGEEAFLFDLQTIGWGFLLRAIGMGFGGEALLVLTCRFFVPFLIAKVFCSHLGRKAFVPFGLAFLVLEGWKEAANGSLGVSFCVWRENLCSHFPFLGIFPSFRVFGEKWC